MFGRGLTHLVGLVGGVLIALGGALALLVDLARGAGSSLLTDDAPAAAALLAVVLGIVAVSVSRPHLFRWGGRLALSGAVLIGVGAIVWVLIALNLLVVVGAALTMLAGVLLFVEGLAVGAHSFRRRFGRRF
ncbi:MAG: hypothetical protein L3K23_01800 [Thermoplasmata archaeon]|nr:hypothetical protein [Thermoplasmata archaeon]